MTTPFTRKTRSQRQERNKNNVLLGAFGESSGSPRSQKTFPKKKHGKLRSFRSKFHLYTGEHLHWLEVTLRLAETVTSAILPWVLLCGGYGFLVSILNNTGHLSIVNDSKVLPHVILSLNIVLSLLLVFRTNTAHERFWEGRKLWGAMVNTVRNLARGIWIVIEEREPEDRTKKEAAARLVVAFSVAMKLHLRRDPMNAELAPLMPPLQYQRLQEVNHAPLEIAFWIGEYLQHQYERQHVNVFQVAALQKSLDDMVDILGGCERILKTPVPLIYTMTLKTLLLTYFLLLPWELVSGLTWWTGPILAFIGFVLLGIDEIGAEIEEPFGHDPNDLPLDAICNTMLRNIDDLLNNAPSNLRLPERPRKIA
jgi:ion channel-forming bestrophin family protein